MYGSLYLRAKREKRGLPPRNTGAKREKRGTPPRSTAERGADSYYFCVGIYLVYTTRRRDEGNVVCCSIHIVDVYVIY